jgi:integrase
MITWVRRRGNQIDMTIRKDGKRTSVPRALIKHLDNEPDHNVEFWVEEYKKKLNISPVILSDQELDKYVEEYLKYLKSRNMSNNTISEHKRHLINHAIPYFLGQPIPMRDPNLWPSISIKLYKHLLDKKLTSGQVFRTNVALRRFYKWLSEERLILGNGDISLRSAVQEVKVTPLENLITPQEVLELLLLQQDSDIKLSLLLGYFCSLRPQEIFGLKRGDFSGGKSIADIECSKSMKSIGLYHKLAVKISRQRNKTKQVLPPKSNSGGWVACFNKEAAEAIVGLLKPMKNEDYIISKSGNKIYSAWNYEFAPKDLRRASLYWLGHNTTISQNQLMKHARHQSFETTLIYLRRPEEEVDTELTLDD